jgi:hypothetical protein
MQFGCSSSNFLSLLSDLQQVPQSTVLLLVSTEWSWIIQQPNHLLDLSFREQIVISEGVYNKLTHCDLRDVFSQTLVED